MKRLFISQPMAGRAEEEILKERENVKSRVESMFCDDVEMVPSYIEEEPPSGVNIGLWYLSKSIEFLSQADIAYFVKGWEDARGCRVENDCAIAYGVSVVVEDYRKEESLNEER